ncbi:hypothetical protein IQ264_07560 [Phormidium sp. LEGE 05292]|uniref:hypothetical protein n=1 Tax=[Phormidium] sp. LEGE 05292 TaxID=767427 RepID=UPI00187EB252|nr:hypothetical protein [Phormidium sp. LEGE 05292]MBE9225288.1 hypothetical protein [Phormidium sp. LEGE 05292]
MVWQSLSDRINNLPLVLAGPILRRTEPNTVTVWIALKEKRSVTLKIFAASSPNQALLIGSHETVQLGQHLHIVAVTANRPTSNTPTANALLPGQTYFYDLEFDNNENLASKNVLNAPGTTTPITYKDFKLPSFSLSPESFNDLRIFQASCRKPHGESLDALATLDTIIQSSVVSGSSKIAPNKRPHQLFLTGDQIYADDVADTLLHMLTDAAAVLLGREETLPDIGKKLTELKPGERNEVVENHCNFTAGSVAKSHLLGLGEFYAMYLFCWSGVLWSELPDYETIFNRKPDKRSSLEKFELEVTQLENFRQQLALVRKALANVPTYMICDDHEITDDWYLNLRWCKQVIGKILGRRVIQNGLLAYAMFQAWGNTPLQFESGLGKELLENVQALSINQSEETEKAIAHLLGLPYSDDEANNFIKDLQDTLELRARLATIPERPWHRALNWHYTVQGTQHEVIVLDTRTWREYPKEDKQTDKDDLGFAGLLSESGFRQQIPLPPSNNTKLTFVISASPVIGVPFVEEIQERLSSTHRLTGWLLKQFNGLEWIRNELDAEAWTFQRSSFERLLAKLAIARSHPILFLSGDVHYGFTARLQYWGKKPFEEENQPEEIKRVIVQMTSSALKNEAGGLFGSRRLHDWGYKPLLERLPEPSEILGWKSSNGTLEIGRKEVVTFENKTETVPWLVSGRPGIVNLVKEREDYTNLQLKPSLEPEWRYRIDYILSKFKRNEVDAQPVEKPIPGGDRQQPMSEYQKMAENHKLYAEKWGDGKEIVGLNNIGEVTFEWNDDRQMLIHTLWWFPQEWEDNTQPPVPIPLTRYEVPLQFDEQNYPKPDVI